MYRFTITIGLVAIIGGVSSWRVGKFTPPSTAPTETTLPPTAQFNDDETTETSIGIAPGNDRKLLTTNHKPVAYKTKNRKLISVQKEIDREKAKCAEMMEIPENQTEKLLMNRNSLTMKEKCWVSCILKRTGFMTHRNRLSVSSVKNVARIVSGNSYFYSYMAGLSAAKCNTKVKTKNKCEAAYRIHKCLTKAIKSNDIPLEY